MQIKWERLKNEYLSSESVTLRSLAQQHGITYARVRQYSAKEGWGKEKKKRLQAAREAIENGAQTVQAQSRLSQTDKINRIAEKLLSNIEEGTELFEKPTHIATLTGALKELTAILRDVNEIPACKDRQKYELDKRKLDLEGTKRNQTQESGGVVILPEVNGGKAAE